MLCKKIIYFLHHELLVFEPRARGETARPGKTSYRTLLSQKATISLWRYLLVRAEFPVSDLAKDDRSTRTVNMPCHLRRLSQPPAWRQAQQLLPARRPELQNSQSQQRSHPRIYPHGPILVFIPTLPSYITHFNSH